VDNLSSGTQAALSEAAPRLRRVLGLWDLIYYGVVTVSPIAPVTVFGLALTHSLGHAVDTILIAMVAVSRLLFGLGRDNVLPRRLFARLEVVKLAIIGRGEDHSMVE
jgi:hypothetical protein